jgi:hypothetical protein
VEYTLEEIAARVRYAFYRQFDGSEGPDGVPAFYWVESVFAASLIVARYGETPAFFRIQYVFTAGLGLDVDVQFAAPDAWEETVYEWVPVERDAAERMKREVFASFEESETDGVVQTRRMNLPGGAAAVQRAAVATETRALESAGDDDDNRSRFRIMTERVARDGAIVDPDGLDVRHYLENPVVLWQHGTDPQRGALPIARTVALERVDATIDGELVRTWEAELEWEPDEFARTIRDAVKRGTVSMSSIGWIGRAEIVTRDGKRVPFYRESELLEFSVVGVGSDRDAVALSRSVDSDVEPPAEVNESPATRSTNPSALGEAADGGNRPRRTFSLDDLRALRDERRRRAREAALRKLGRA